MSKKLLCILGILATIIVGAFLYWKYVCECGGGSGREVTADKSVVAIPDEKPPAPAAVSDSSMAVNWLEEKQKLNADPLVVYFDLNSNVVRTDQIVREKADRLISFLKNSGNANLEITGHTDNTGQHELNIKLGHERAQAAKTFLVDSGASATGISCTSAGPDNPVADNGSPEGRAKNRCAVVIIK